MMESAENRSRYDSPAAGKSVARSNHLVQRGPAFRTMLEVSCDRATGQYSGRYTDEKGEERALNGTLEMPPHLYNGMTAMLLRNLPHGARETV